VYDTRNNAGVRRIDELDIPNGISSNHIIPIYVYNLANRKNEVKKMQKGILYKVVSGTKKARIAYKGHFKNPIYAKKKANSLTAIYGWKFRVIKKL
jgi:hypothetical protein